MNAFPPTFTFLNPREDLVWNALLVYSSGLDSDVLSDHCFNYVSSSCSSRSFLLPIIFSWIDSSSQACGGREIKPLGTLMWVFHSSTISPLYRSGNEKSSGWLVWNNYIDPREQSPPPPECCWTLSTISQRFFKNKNKIRLFQGKPKLLPSGLFFCRFQM